MDCGTIKFMSMRRVTIICIVLFASLCVLAQSNVNGDKYRRSSLYSVLLDHPDKKMSKEIRSAFLNIDIPDKFNDHNLSVKYLTMTKDKSASDEERVSEFLRKNQVAKRMVSKWFNRDKQSGSFDMSLIQERGKYNANAIDIEVAKRTIRGTAGLADSGEELIENTFIIVNDIKYIDKEKNAEIAANVLATIANIAGAVFGAGSIGDMIKAAAQLGQAISKTIAGFTVKTESYLYQLEWNNEIADEFYARYYFDSQNIDMSKKMAFEADSTLFKLKYIGKYSANSQQTVMRGLYLPEDVFKKVLTRALDKNIVELQKEYDVFKVMVPIAQTSPVIKAPLGKKEGVSSTSKYEVVERYYDVSTKSFSYKRVGVIKPLQIWDNRYMSVEEGAEDADLGYSTFEKVSGTKDFSAGMLIREIKFNAD